MPRQFDKHFTLDEARAALPKLRRHFSDIHRSRNRLLELDRALAKRFAKGGGDLGGAPVDALMKEYLSMQLGLRRISSLGILIKDVDRGLVDFPHLREGNEVLLCWELEEDDIEFWHDLESGYAGRERL
jgi:hypothetical protein